MRFAGWLSLESTPILPFPLQEEGLLYAHGYQHDKLSLQHKGILGEQDACYMAAQHIIDWCLSQKHEVDYFIERFNEIPERRWCRHLLTNHLGQSCAYGHLNCEERKILDGLAVNIMRTTHVICANDSEGHPDYPGDTPKQRVLKYLRGLKARMRV